ncbi:MAG: hypothetical protein ACE5GE_02415 [Phycisphaerae bacterium]
MIRSTCITVLSAGVLAGLAGCSQWWQSFQPGPQRKSPTQTVAQAPEAADEVPVEPEPDPAPVDDTHQPETVAQVLEFVDRLNVVSNTDDSERPVIPADQDSTEASPATETGLTVNAGVDLKAVPQPLEPADEQTGPLPPVIESVFVRGALTAETDEGPDPTGGAANVPVSADPPEDRLSLEQMVTLLGDHVAQTPSDLRAQWQLKLLQMVQGDDDAARHFSEELAEDSAQFLGQLVETLIAGRELLENPVTSIDTALDSVETLRESLAQQADLRIPTVALCSRVKTFGVFDELPASALLPHEANRAIVYLEVDNFLSEQTAGERYRTVLNGELEVLTASGQQVWQHAEPQIVDLCRTRRRDFFLAQLVTLPATLGAGEYVLKVTLEDELSGKMTQAIHPFQVGTAAVVEAGP